MNPFVTPESITVDGVSIKVPIFKGQEDILSPNFTFQKPCWVPDTEVASCLSCNIKFTQLRRKHHCRNCGKIFCSKCCFEKMYLPHFGITELEKVCSNCKLVVELMTKAKSDDKSLKYEAVTGLSNLTKNVAGLCKVIECGGIHVMFSLAVNGDTTLKGAVASALNNIAQTMTLNAFLVNAGCLKVLKNLLQSPSNCDQLLSDCLSALNLLCTDNNIKIEVLKEGILDVLLTIINFTGTTAVFACRILQVLVSNFDHHEFILQNYSRIIPALFEALKNEDYQMLSCISKILVYFSAGSDFSRHSIIQEDVAKGFPLIYLLKSVAQNILVNVVCIIANLSLSIEQNSAHQYIAGLCDLLNGIDRENNEVLIHLGRGLANFAESHSNSLQLIHNLQIIVPHLLHCDCDIVKIHACRMLTYLLASEPSFTLDLLSQSGMNEFIEIIFELPDITNILNNLLLRRVSRLSVCK